MTTNPLLLCWSSSNEQKWLSFTDLLGQLFSVPHRLGLFVSFSWLVNQPPLPRYPPRNKALRSGLMIHWFPLIRPYQSLISEGGMSGGVGMLWPININWICVYQVYGLKTWMFIPQKMLQDRPTSLSNHQRWVVSTNSFDPRKPRAIPQKKEKGWNRIVFSAVAPDGRLTWNLRIPLEKENHLPNHHFQVLCESSGVYSFYWRGFDCFLWWESKFATIGELWYAFSVYSLDGQVIWDILCWDSSNSYRFCFGTNKNTSPACCFASWASKVTKALPPAGGALSWTNHQLKCSSNWMIFPVIPVKIKHLKTATQLWNGPEWWLIIPY